MTQFCGAHRVPRAGVDVIDAAEPALAVVRLAMAQPLVAETVALILDGDRRGRSIVVVDGTVEPDAVVAVVERLAESVAASGEPGALVVATVRPCAALLPDDADRWTKVGEIADLVGVDLLEWFVIGRHEGGPVTVWCPRDLLAEPQRWTG
ncbi:MAG: hypothetical protein M3487_08515 [Actinomycetota bacterium]|nr:hypothetical protein [Actinomycetota bacterium]